MISMTNPPPPTYYKEKPKEHKLSVQSDILGFVVVVAIILYVRKVILNKIVKL